VVKRPAREIDLPIRRVADAENVAGEGRNRGTTDLRGAALALQHVLTPS